MIAKVDSLVPNQLQMLKQWFARQVDNGIKIPNPRRAKSDAPKSVEWSSLLPPKSISEAHSKFRWARQVVLKTPIRQENVITTEMLYVSMNVQNTAKFLRSVTPTKKGFQRS